MNSNPTNTLESMTGFASSEILTDTYALRAQIKSVNNRFFELRIRAPRWCLPYEHLFKSSLKKILKRGSVELTLEQNTSENTESSLDPNTASQARALFENFRAVLEHSKPSWGESIDGALAAQIILDAPEVWKPVNHTLPHKPEGVIGFVESLGLMLLEQRRHEGAVIAEILNAICEKLQTLHTELRGEIPAIRTEWEQGLRSRLEKLIEPSLVLDEGRLEQELLYLAEKRDVTEELDRIGIHLNGLAAVLREAGEQKGKKLDFIAQELLREWNTLGNKLGAWQKSSIVIDAKLEIEKIKEQALNVV